MSDEREQRTAGAAADQWVDDLAAAIGGADGRAEAERLAAAAPPGYRQATTPAEAADDLRQLNALIGAGERTGPGQAPPVGGPGSAGGGLRLTPVVGGRAFGGSHRLAIRPVHDGAPGSFRIRRFGLSAVELTSFLPVLESFGLVVAEAVPYRLSFPGQAGPVHVDDVGVRLGGPAYGGAPPPFSIERDGPRLVAALEAVAASSCSVDSLNRLVTLASLDWPQVAVMRAYRRYWHQSGISLTDAQMDGPLAAYPDVARALVEYFEARFDPSRAGDDGLAEAARKAVLAGLDGVPDLEHDRVLRGYLALIDATLRTSRFRPDAGAGTVVLKLDSARVPDLPAPRPRVETWVHGPGIEGIHLRAGLIARGGIRWSERPDDFRTEVLDLAMAQVKKNAIIVPTGAKGGFVCRRPEAPSPPDVRAAYETFIAGLLDITDNVVGGRVVTPTGVVAYDGADTYLVVAADKGTASFSDVANALSEGRGFWLGDAFASGGSRGYDHKAMGITAKGAWVAVRRHFHQLGIDVQTEPIRVVGVGDMSGDVFGNGMLRSPAIRLIAAFDHRHVFIDPDPDPAASFVERARLFGLGPSSWADYDRQLLSRGGGVWARTEKRIPVAPEARRALGIDATELTPPELISAILAAPADLLWFGGIGTYIKAPGESDAAVGDHANDDLRITADQVRCRVIAEGGNLGITQAARVRYSRRGGRINTDFIDNAAGVATSDREVNLKILLALAIEEGRLDPAARDTVLADCTDDVGDAVLRQVDHSVAALSRAVPASASELDAYEALLDELERAGLLDRAVEELPDAEELAVRRRAGAGLIRPELAVLLAYAKSHLVEAIEASSIVADPALEEAVQAYFPAQIRERFGTLVPRHGLYRQLVATDVAGEIVDQMGVIWANELATELGRRVCEVAGAFWAARQVLDAGDLWDALESQPSGVGADAEAHLHRLVSDAVDALARSYLRRPGPVAPADLIAHDRPLARDLAASGRPGGSEAGRAEEDELVAAGVDHETAARYVGTALLARLSDASEVSRQLGRPVETVVAALAEIDAVSGADRLARLLARIPPAGRWSRWEARALFDDLAGWRRTALVQALQAAPRGSPDDAVAAWAGRAAESLAHTASLLAELDPSRPDALSLAGLIVRSLRRSTGEG